MKNIYPIILFFLLSQGFIFAQEIDSLLDNKSRNTEVFDIKNLSINSDNSDYGVAYYTDGKIIFSSTRKDKENSSRRWKGNDQYFLNFFMGDSIVAGDVMHYTSLKGMANSKFHESNAVFNKERTKVYFTRNTLYESRKGLSIDRKLKLSIYIADVKPDGSWYNIVPFPYNSDEYSNGHPTLSLDGNTMYFVSDMPGTIGRSDIFKVSITSTGTFTVPENLGGNVNTVGREMFPFIAPDGTLYFSSDGHQGEGKLDIFKTDSDELELAAIQNIGEPFNGSRDDFAFVLNDNMLEGYFSSNRPGGKGDDDIYYFSSSRLRNSKPNGSEKTLPLICENTIKGSVTDANDLLPLYGCLVEIIDNDNVTVFKEVINDAGTFSFKAKCSSSYLIRASKEFYLPEEVTLQTTDELGFELPVNISLIPEIIKRGDKILIDIESIYFDFDDYSITKQAAKQLDRVIAFMFKYPETIIEGSSHTDSRGNENYNLTLSAKRAQSTVSYIMRNGNFTSDRISAKGYGETAPVNHCIDGVKCSEEEHAVNRRTEFEVINPDKMSTR